MKAYPADPLAPEVKFVAAEADLQLGKYPEAEKLFDDLLAGQASHADADQWKVRRALTLNLQKKHAETVKALEPVAAKLKTPELVAEANYLLGILAVRAASVRRGGRSAPGLDRRRAQWRQADETLLAEAQAERAQNKTAEAIATVKKMLAEFPQSKLLDRAHFRLGELLAASGDNKQAAAEYKQVLEKWPDSPLVPNALFSLGWAELVGKEFQPSVDTLTRLIEKYPDNPLVARARYARGMARQQLKQFDAGIEDIQAFLKSNPSATEKSDALYVAGLCEVGRQKYGPAIEIFRGILKDDPSYAGSDKVIYEVGLGPQERWQGAGSGRGFRQAGQGFSRQSAGGRSHVPRRRVVLSGQGLRQGGRSLLRCREEGRRAPTSARRPPTSWPGPTSSKASTRRPSRASSIN